MTLCHTGTQDLKAETIAADIIVAAAGKGHMLTADMVKPGAACLMWACPGLMANCLVTFTLMCGQLPAMFPPTPVA